MDKSVGQIPHWMLRTRSHLDPGKVGSGTSATLAGENQLQIAPRQIGRRALTASILGIFLSTKIVRIDHPNKCDCKVITTFPNSDLVILQRGERRDGNAREAASV
jgi:hypothetical protein